METTLKKTKVRPQSSDLDSQEVPPKSSDSAPVRTFPSHRLYATKQLYVKKIAGSRPYDWGEKVPSASALEDETNTLRTTRKTALVPPQSSDWGGSPLRICVVRNVEKLHCAQPEFHQNAKLARAPRPPDPSQASFYYPLKQPIQFLIFAYS